MLLFWSLSLNGVLNQYRTNSSIFSLNVSELCLIVILAAPVIGHMIDNTFSGRPRKHPLIQRHAFIAWIEQEHNESVML